MTKNKLNKANEIDMKIRRFEAYKKFAENFKDINKHCKTDVLIEVGNSDNWKIREKKSRLSDGFYPGQRAI